MAARSPQPAAADPVRVAVHGFAHGGEGVGRPQGESGPTWFVAGAVPGEVVEARPLKAAKRFVRGELLRVVESGPARVDPPCELADRCGGCSWQHVRADAQGELKATIVREQLRKVASPDQVRLVFAGDPAGYRRRARLHWRSDDGRLGFYAAASRDVVDTPGCPVLHPALLDGINRLRPYADALGEAGEVLGLTDGEHTVVGLPGARTDAARELESALGGALVGIEVRGGRRQAHVGRRTLALADADGAVPMRASAFVFTQPQAEGNRALVRFVERAARASGKRVLELYAGAGNFTRALARHAQRVWASDSDREAVDLVRELAKRNGLPINAKRQTAERLLPKLAQAQTQYDVVVADPPRAGLGREAMAAACAVANERIVLVSCDPATAARDLDVAKASGFDIEGVAVFDLMPMTPEVETVTSLVRTRGRG